MSSDRGPATPVGIGVSSTSGVNIVIKSPCLFAFLLAWMRPPLGSFLQGARSAYCVLKAPLFKKHFIFLSLRQQFGRLWDKVGNSWVLRGTIEGGGSRLKSESGG